MIIDHENLLSYKQAVTVTANSENVLDLGPPLHTGASGADEIPLFMHCDEAFLAAGAGTLTVAIQSSPVENFGSAVVTHYTSPAIAKTELAQPKRMPLNMNLPPDVQRYVRATYTVGTGPFTAGKITLGVTGGRQTNY